MRRSTSRIWAAVITGTSSMGYSSIVTSLHRVVSEDVPPMSRWQTAPEAAWSLLDHMAMTEELSALAGRAVDLVTRRAVERSPNRIKRKAILSPARPYYAAGRSG